MAKKYIDAEKLKAEIRIIQQSVERRDVRFNQIEKIRTGSMVEVCKCILNSIDSLQQEQPEVDLEKEYKEYVEDDPVFSKLTNRNVGLVIARHFYELGLNSRKEE